MRGIAFVILFSVVLFVANALQCETEQGAFMLMYRICASDYQCATQNQITPESILRGYSLDSSTSRLHNGGYQVMSHTIQFLQLIRSLDFATENDFATASMKDAELHKGDIFYAIWESPIATQMPRVFYHNNGTRSGATNCRALAISSDPLPRDMMMECTASLYALTTYKAEIATPAECSNINEDRILDVSSGQYYCSCRPGKVCIEGNHLLPTRITMLAIAAAAGVFMVAYTTWKGGAAFYSVDKLESHIAKDEEILY